MSRERWRAVARVEKTHGRRGEVVAVPVHGLPPLLHDGLVVAVVPPQLRGSRTRTVASCSDGGPGQLVSLDGVCDLNASTALVGKTLLVRTSDLPDGWELRDADAMVGRRVIDRRLGLVGCVSAVLTGGNGRMALVAGERGEVLVPLVDALVEGIDADTGALRTCLPVGLAPWDAGHHAD